MIPSGDLGHIDAAFSGWTCKNGKLVSPEWWSVPIEEVRAVPFLRQQLGMYQADNRQLKRQLSELRGDGLVDQPLPDAPPASLLG
jgi:hypothetical protein